MTFRSVQGCVYFTWALPRAPTLTPSRIGRLPASAPCRAIAAHLLAKPARCFGGSSSHINSILVHINHVAHTSCTPSFGQTHPSLASSRLLHGLALHSAMVSTHPFCSALLPACYTSPQFPISPLHYSIDDEIPYIHNVHYSKALSMP
ncbi:unnamed protein product [Periconia digitata]|uniref:Uncharacterized protein n=1 Tax=Periconia digitata TaxID=1303443 RepID=A0A9W4XRG3_9PLEO|nr:unnamed protein product [Periconia digitata]